MGQTLLYMPRWLLGALPAMLLCVPVVGHARYGVLNEASPLMLAHIAVAVATMLVFVAALGLVVLLWLQTRRLNDLRGGVGQSSWLDRVPPVLSLERILFRVLWAGFVLLSVLVVSGMFFGELVWGHALVFSHKVLLTVLAWFLFGALLAGRSLLGWRGRTAVWATVFGFALLFLAYAGTHFVLNVVLKR